MNLNIVGTLPHQRFTAGAAGDDGMPSAPSWGTANVNTYGWWPPSPEQILGVEPGRRAQEIQMAALVPQGTVCGDRDKWTVGGVAFEQVAGPQDYSHGPFGMAVPLIVYLKQVEG